MRVVGGWTTCKRSKLNEGDCLKRVLIMCLMAFILSGCSKEEKPVSRAVFAWDGVVESDKQILESHQIDTIFMGLNHYSAVPGYNIYLLAGDPSWGLEDMEKVVEEAKEKKADGVLFDIEGNYVTLASNLSLLESDLPIYVCMPFWLEEELQEQIIKAVDGVVVMNYSKGNERANLEEEMAMADQYDKAILTAYELQPVGEYGLGEYNTYNEDGLDAVEKNYNEQFGGTDVGIAFHNLNMMRELNPAGIEGK